MSEYQYYEFQAVDRPLTPAEIAELRALSTRATITPTRLQNVYHWGDFKGKPLELMMRYFDAFVYVANWGTHRFMVRLPRRLLDPQLVQPYGFTEALTIHASGDSVILEFISEDEEGMGWVEDEEAEGWMPALLPLRADLASGDWRALYLGWLAGAAADMIEEEMEPPVPPGLGHLSASLSDLARFLRIDDDLLAIAATASAAAPQAPGTDDLQQWIGNLPTAEKDALLLRLATDPAHARAEILRRSQEDNTPQLEARADRRTVAMLLSAAEKRAAERRLREAARQAAERARREQAAAVAREKHLDNLAGRDEELWRQVDSLVETKRVREYDQAVQVLVDLHDLAARHRSTAAFAARLAELRERYAKRRGLLERLDRAGLSA
jgi:hypothetical protein